MNILVVGGAGYIGSHTCKALVAAGHTPIAYDNLSQGHDWAVKWGPLVRGDILDGEALDQVFARYQIDGVIHFAASCYVGESVADPATYYHNNVVGSWTLLDAMRRAGCLRLVFSSTCATYGNVCAVPIREDQPQNPINPYGASKLMVERILADYRAAYGLQATVFRYFNASGADADGEIGEQHDPEPHLIPRLLDVAAGRVAQAEVYGADYPTADGSCIRDYIHVSDLADAHVLGMQGLLDGAAGGVYNLGTGAGVSVLEMIGVVERETGCRVPYAIHPRRPGDPAQLVADPRAAQRDLGWCARHSSPQTIVASAWRWYTRNMSEVGEPARTGA